MKERTDFKIECDEKIKYHLVVKNGSEMLTKQGF